MSSDVLLAAMMPASRAACSGSPFLTVPARISRRAVADMLTVPRATASRAVTASRPHPPSERGRRARRESGADSVLLSSLTSIPCAR